MGPVSRSVAPASRGSPAAALAGGTCWAHRVTRAASGGRVSGGGSGGSGGSSDVRGGARFAIARSQQLSFFGRPCHQQTRTTARRFCRPNAASAAAAAASDAPTTPDTAADTAVDTAADTAALDEVMTHVRAALGLSSSSNGSSSAAPRGMVWGEGHNLGMPVRWCLRHDGASFVDEAVGPELSYVSGHHAGSNEVWETDFNGYTQTLQLDDHESALLAAGPYTSPRSHSVPVHTHEPFTSPRSHMYRCTLRGAQVELEGGLVSGPGSRGGCAPAGGRTPTPPPNSKSA